MLIKRNCVFLQFKFLMMKLDPSEEDSDDSGNGGRDSPVGEGGQMTDLEVCYSTVSFWPAFGPLHVTLEKS